MNITKSRLEDLVKELPEGVDIEEVMYRLYLLQKIEAGETSIREGAFSQRCFSKAIKKMAELIWSEDAISDLEGIYDYIARDSPLYARHQVELLL